jgi:TolB protein
MSMPHVLHARPALLRRLLAGTVIAVAVVAALTAAAILTAPPSLAAVADSSSSIAFVTTRSGYDQVWTVDPTTGIESQLTPGTKADSDPAWSPLGDRIAFARSGDIWVANADGTHARDITASDPYTDAGPTWSPDGRRIAFVSDQDTAGRTQIFVMSKGGANVKRLTTDAGTDTQPRWSPNGKWIAFVSTQTGRPEIFRMKPSGKSPIDLTGTSSDNDDPAWSPDSSTIMFTSSAAHPGSVGADLWTMSAGGGTATPFIHESNGYSDGAGASYSPDGTEVVFSANNGQGSTQLWTVSAAGGQNTRLTNDSGNPRNTEADW